MKFAYLIIMLLASLLLTSCENNNSAKNNNTNPNNDNYSISRENTPNNQTERLSYKEYVEKYGEITNQENNYKNSEEDFEKSLDEIQIENKLTAPKTSISSYSTPLLGSSAERINNLKIVCERLNNFILKPSETFSYNETVGPYGPSDGFKEATILLSDGSKSKGYGGGVCQLSSTLYNVVKNIENVEIVERHHHSAPVAYVPKDEDATISLQSNLDFKFVNNNDYSIRFEATCANGNVTVKAYKEV